MEFATSLALTALAAVLLSAPALGQTAPSIYDAGRCTSDGHCAAWQYCAGTSCTPRKPNGEECETVNECRFASYCAPVDLDRPWRGSACAPRARFGRRCAPGPDSCVRGLLCRDGKCATARTARAGQDCVPRGTDCAPGLYCRRGEFFVRPDQCTRRVGVGASCTDTLQCAGGYCNEEGKCAKLVPRSGPCALVTQCAGWDHAGYSRDPVVCNRPMTGKGGVCERSSTLRGPGEACSPGRDTCDMSRNLHCKFARRALRPVCQTRQGFADSFCKQGSDFSRCDAGLVCRSKRDVPRLAFFKFVRSTDVTLCLPRAVRVFAGQPCVVERYMCAGATTCRIVPGVRGGPPAAYCVRTLRLGAACAGTSKFVALCEDGAVCRAGTCVKKGGGDVKATHSGKDVACGKGRLPCARGLACKFGSCTGGFMFNV